MRGLGLALAFATLGAVGCGEYRYYDVNVILDPVTLGNGVSGGIQRCHATVTKANGDLEDEFDITDPRTPSSLSCPLNSSRTSGTFEYSTKSSGSLTFSVSVFDDQRILPACEIGKGQATIEGSETTNAADLTVVATGAAGCT
jgi:hypothetical protein